MEHDPQGGVEWNHAQPGRNCNWPLVSQGCGYGTPVGQCTPVGGASSAADIEPSISVRVPTSIAPSGMLFYSGSGFPEWQGQLFMGALAGQALWRIELNGDQVQSRKALFGTLTERIRHVRLGLDGWIYRLADSSNGRTRRVQRQ